jgi:hypothetical protein
MRRRLAKLNARKKSSDWEEEVTSALALSRGGGGRREKNHEEEDGSRVPPCRALGVVLSHSYSRSPATKKMRKIIL